MGTNGESTKVVNQKPSPIVDFSAGVFAGAAGLVVGQPFDVVKVRYQTPQFAGVYKSTWGALGAILKDEKVHGLFKGVTSPMAGVAFINGIIFTSYSYIMGLQVPHESPIEPSLLQITIAGAGAGVLGSLIASPTELIKIRQQSAPPHAYPSTLSVFRSIIRQDGFRGLYRGFSATAPRDLAYGPYFLTYEGVCRYFRSRKHPPPPVHPHHHDSLIEEAEEELASLTWPELMTAGGLAGVVAWIATFPLDVFKTRMQAVPWDDGRVQGNARILKVSLYRVATDAVRNEGWRVMFAGLGPTLIRAVPANMVIFLTFEGIASGLTRLID